MGRRPPTFALVLAFLRCSCSAWVPLQFDVKKTLVRSPSASPISVMFNLPPPSEQNVAEFVEYASRMSPPASFFELQQDSIRAARLARQDGHKLLEIEFPPLPAEIMDMNGVSAYEIADANINLALNFCKGLMAAEADTNSNLKKIAILLPDEAEAKFSVERAGSANPYPGIIISSLRRSDEGDDRIVKPEQFLLSMFGRRKGFVKALPDVDLYLCLTASAQELPDIEELHNLDPDKTIIMYNMKLDVLRGDLGAPAFPSRDFQDRFLSKVKPVYYIRTRQYTRSTPNPPFLVNFQGCLFRCYPGEYQTLLDTGKGRYRRLCGSDVRPALGEFKDQLTTALKEQGILQEEGSTLNFLRTGYKVKTWWEEDRENADNAWRT